MNCLFIMICDLALMMGWRSIKDQPGCVEIDVGDGWKVWINGHGETTECSQKVHIAPYSMYLEHRGWPAGIINVSGGSIVAGDAINEISLIRSIEKKMMELDPDQGAKLIQTYQCMMMDKYPTE